MLTCSKFLNNITNSKCCTKFLHPAHTRNVMTTQTHEMLEKKIPISSTYIIHPLPSPLVHQPVSFFFCCLFNPQRGGLYVIIHTHTQSHTQRESYNHIILISIQHYRSSSLVIFVHTHTTNKHVYHIRDSLPHTQRRNKVGKFLKNYELFYTFCCFNYYRFFRQHEHFLCTYLSLVVFMSKLN